MVTKLYRISCAFCKYHMDVDKELINWAHKIIARHYNNRHEDKLKQVEELNGIQEAQKEESEG